MTGGPEPRSPYAYDSRDAAGCGVRGMEPETQLQLGDWKVPVDGITAFPAAISAESRIWPDANGSRSVDVVAEEVPVALAYNGVSHVVMMATPADLVDFAVGFSLSEGIVASAGDVYGVRVRTTDRGVIVDLDIAPDQASRLDGGRNLTGRTGCGLCGVSSLEQAIRPLHPVRSHPPIRLDRIRAALDCLPAWQVLNGVARSLHAAAWTDGSGTIQIAREDVGRHNALDKLIGALARQDIPKHDGCAIATSRCSYEMVQKAAAAGIGVLVTVSAPTALALRIAEDAGVAVVALARRDSCRIYTCSWRLQPDSEPHAPERASAQRETDPCP